MESSEERSRVMLETFVSPEVSRDEMAAAPRDGSRAPRRTW